MKRQCGIIFIGSNTAFRFPHITVFRIKLMISEEKCGLKSQTKIMQVRQEEGKRYVFLLLVFYGP